MTEFNCDHCKDSEIEYIPGGHGNIWETPCTVCQEILYISELNRLPDLSDYNLLKRKVTCEDKA